MTLPAVTVVIPTFGRSALLTEAVDSVLAQSFDDLECIVVDDASPEPVSMPSHPKLRVIRMATNGGPGAARNFGIEAALGAHVAFLDSDDRYTTDRLELVADRLGSNRLVLCRMAGLDEPDRATGRKLDGRAADTILDDYTPHLGQLTAPTNLVPRFDETFRACEDIEWWLRTARVAEFETVDSIGYLFRTHGEVRHGNGARHRIAERQKMLELHREWFAQHPRAASFQWRRMGLTSLELGDRKAAIRSLSRALKLRPTARGVTALVRVAAP